MRILRALWFNFQMYREMSIRQRYFETEKGKAEKDRVYWAERKAYLRKVSHGI